MENNKTKQDLKGIWLLISAVFITMIGAFICRVTLNKDTPSFYQKLAAGKDVNILIVGDSISAGYGSSDEAHRWSELFAEELRSKYNIEVGLTNVSMDGNSSYAGIVRTMILDDGIDYDLVVLAYGQNDNKKDHFDVYYEALVRAAKNKYPKASVICILESSQREYTKKIKTIQEIAEHYELPIVDTIAPFKEEYDLLTIDKYHPNDAGQEVYCSAVMEVVEPLVESDYGRDKEDVSVMSEETGKFESITWYPVDKFTREGNTFIIKTTGSFNVMGVDYELDYEDNKFTVLIDGNEYVDVDEFFKYQFSQRRIFVINKWAENKKVDINNEIRIVFADDEVGTAHADGFYGLALNYFD